VEENGLGNVIVEGTYPGDSENCYFGMYGISIREETVVIVERIKGKYWKRKRHQRQRRNKFVLYGNVSNGGRITKIDKKSLRGNGLTTQFKNPISQTGMVRTNVKGPEIPRMLVFEDGRIFVRRFIRRKTVLENSVYERAIPSIVKVAWNWFVKFGDETVAPACEEEKKNREEGIGITEFLDWGIV